MRTPVEVMLAGERRQQPQTPVQNAMKMNVKARTNMATMERAISATQREEKQ
jgi:hypothetical protein